MPILTFSVTLHAFECTHASGTPECRTCVDYKWVYLKQTKKICLPGSQQEIFRRITKVSWPGRFLRHTIYSQEGLGDVGRDIQVDFLQRIHHGGYDVFNRHCG